MAAIATIRLSEARSWGRMDAEFFQPRYTSIAQALRGCPQLGSLVHDPILHPAEVKREYVASGVPFLLAQYIRAVLLEFDEPAQIAPSVAETIPHNGLSGGDVLVTRTGANYGDCAVYLGEPHPFYASAHCLVIRPRSVAGEYLAVYLNTSVARALVKRGAYGSSQPELAPTYLRTIPIVRLGKIEDKVVRLVQEAHDQTRAAKNLYPKAERLLLERLGWDEVDSRHVLAYETRLSSARQAARLDAEHFQPKYNRLLRHLQRTCGHRRLKEITLFLNHGPQPPYSEEGEIPVITQRHMGATLMELSIPDQNTTMAFWQANRDFQVRWRDVLFYSVGAYLGRTNMFPSRQPAMAGSYITIIRPDPSKCLPEYLALYLNSPLGQLQSEKHRRASAQQYIYPTDIARFVISIPTQEDGRPDLDWQRQLAALVVEGYRARAVAQKKIEEAKRLVESTIRETIGLG
jgi:hypothetical protein